MKKSSQIFSMLISFALVLTTTMPLKCVDPATVLMGIQTAVYLKDGYNFVHNWWVGDKLKQELRVLKVEVGDLRKEILIEEKKVGSLISELVSQTNEKQHVEKKLQQIKNESHSKKNELRRIYFKCLKQHGEERCQMSSKLFDSDSDSDEEYSSNIFRIKQ